MRTLRERFALAKDLRFLVLAVLKMDEGVTDELLALLFDRNMFFMHFTYEIVSKTTKPIPYQSDHLQHSSPRECQPPT